MQSRTLAALLAAGFVLLGGVSRAEENGRLALGLREGTALPLGVETSWRLFEQAELTAGYAGVWREPQTGVARLGLTLFPMPDPQADFQVGLSYQLGWTAAFGLPVHTVGVRAAHLSGRTEVYLFAEEVLFVYPGGLSPAHDLGFGVSWFLGKSKEGRHGD